MAQYLAQINATPQELTVALGPNPSPEEIATAAQKVLAWLTYLQAAAQSDAANLRLMQMLGQAGGPPTATEVVARVASCATPCSPCGSLPTPFKRRRLSIPSSHYRFQPADDFICHLFMLTL